MTFGIEFITDLLSPSDAQAGNDSIVIPTGVNKGRVQSDKDTLSDVPRQWSFVLQLGAMF